jgi:hypothetical protein
LPKLLEDFKSKIPINKSSGRKGLANLACEFTIAKTGGDWVTLPYLKICGVKPENLLEVNSDS